MKEEKLTQLLKELEREGIVTIKDDTIELTDTFYNRWLKHTHHLTHEHPNKDPYKSATILAYLEHTHPNAKTKEQIVTTTLILAPLLIKTIITNTKTTTHQ